MGYKETADILWQHGQKQWSDFQADVQKNSSFINASLIKKAILLPNETIKCTNLNYPLKSLFEVKQVRLITTLIEIIFASLLHLLIEYPKATVSKKTIALDV